MFYCGIIYSKWFSNFYCIIPWVLTNIYSPATNSPGNIFITLRIPLSPFVVNGSIPPMSWSLETTGLLSIDVFLHSPEVHINGTVDYTYIIFCAWFLSFSMMILRCIHVADCISVSFCIWLNRFFSVCVHVHLLMDSWFVSWFGLFWNKIAVNI